MSTNQTPKHDQMCLLNFIPQVITNKLFRFDTQHMLYMMIPCKKKKHKSFRFDYDANNVLHDAMSMLTHRFHYIRSWILVNLLWPMIFSSIQ